VRIDLVPQRIEIRREGLQPRAIDCRTVLPGGWRPKAAVWTIARQLGMLAEQNVPNDRIQCLGCCAISVPPGRHLCPLMYSSRASPAAYAARTSTATSCASTARRCGEGGFAIGNTGGTPEHFDAGPHNWIHHNVVDGCRYGIHIYRQSHCQYVEDNTFVNNRTLGVASSTRARTVAACCGTRLCDGLREPRDFSVNPAKGSLGSVK
jgi:hypothetical protein